ncbi:unnamed protein product [Owenia fusiformis]|uniref:alpha-L-fucosidase n=1 Tax=Owenia fusiformis TaxID=6347 RepID=A0A8S4MUA1_OWEFU|nr:unnamed protein product [Owenia fusiformis]
MPSEGNTNDIKQKVKGNNDVKQTKQTGKNRYKPTWESLETRPLPSWYDKGKIGIFIHWGVFSVPAFVGAGSGGYAEWFWMYWKGGDEMKDHVRHRLPSRSVQEYMKRRYPPDWEYTDFAPQFTAEFFDPEHWARVFKASGAKYVVLTSKHHDGFCMWPSKKSWNWNAMDNGPHRDLVGDLGDAVREAGLKYGLYHSLYEWFNPYYLDDKANNFKTQSYVREKMLPEMYDLVQRYKPDIFWSDGHHKNNHSYFNSTQFVAWLYNESPVKDTVIVNDRWGMDVECKHGGYLTCSDKFNPGHVMERKWENCMTIDQESYGYRRNAKVNDYFDINGILKIVAETVSCGGNVLINIGPTADGRIPPVFEERLYQLGEWMNINGEGIYDTVPWIHQNDQFNKDVWYTSRDKTVYAITLKWPRNDILELHSMNPTAATKVSWLGFNGTLKWTSDGGRVLVNMPTISMNDIPCLWAWVFKFENTQ